MRFRSAQTTNSVLTCTLRTSRWMQIDLELKHVLSVRRIGAQCKASWRGLYVDPAVLRNKVLPFIVIALEDYCMPIA